LRTVSVLNTPACGALKSIRLGSLTSVVTLELPVMIQVESTRVTLETLPGSVVTLPVSRAFTARTLATAADPAANGALVKAGGVAQSGSTLGSNRRKLGARNSKVPDWATRNQSPAPVTDVPVSVTLAVPPSTPIALPAALLSAPPFSVACCTPLSLDISRP